LTSPVAIDDLDTIADRIIVIAFIAVNTAAGIGFGFEAIITVVIEAYGRAIEIAMADLITVVIVVKIFNLA